MFRRFVYLKYAQRYVTLYPAVMDGAKILSTEATTVTPGLIREETQFSQTGRDEGLFSCAYPHVPTFVLFRAYVWGCTVSFMRNE